MPVIADAGPLRYLIGIGEHELLPAIFGEVRASNAVGVLRVAAERGLIDVRSVVARLRS